MWLFGWTNVSVYNNWGKHLVIVLHNWLTDKAKTLFCTWTMELFSDKMNPWLPAAHYSSEYSVTLASWYWLSIPLRVAIYTRRLHELAGQWGVRDHLVTCKWGLLHCHTEAEPNELHDFPSPPAHLIPNSLWIWKIVSLCRNQRAYWQKAPPQKASLINLQ